MNHKERALTSYPGSNAGGKLDAVTFFQNHLDAFGYDQKAIAHLISNNVDRLRMLIPGQRSRFHEGDTKRVEQMIQDAKSLLQHGNKQVLH